MPICRRKWLSDLGSSVVATRTVITRISRGCVIYVHNVPHIMRRGGPAPDSPGRG
jgi:hypothetical protein